MNQQKIKKVSVSISFWASLLVCTSVSADVVEKKITYKQGQANLVGYQYSDTDFDEKSPGILLFSDWMGVNSFAKDRAKELAVSGVKVFVADIYGDGKVAKDQTEASQLATKFKSDRPLLRLRAQAALDALLKDPKVDSTKVGAMGFCFGGTAALELARSGAPLKAVVSFHGGLETPDKTLAKNIKGKLLILHGAEDPFVPPAEVAAFEEEMTKAKVTWELTKYSGAVHAFTNPDAGTDNSKGAAYNELASGRAFGAMSEFFSEEFAEDYIPEEEEEVSIEEPIMSEKPPLPVK
jgi:dienelactone hydrolase